MQQSRIKLCTIKYLGVIELGFIDLRSDTVTMPTEEMRAVMAKAEVGDDVYGDDPTVKKLEEKAAQLLGKEAALFVPTGTMGNQLAVMSHTRRGDEIIAEEECHIVEHEVGAAAVVAGVHLRAIKGVRGVMDPAAVENAIREDDIHYPNTGLICVENALSNGTVVPLETMQKIYEIGKRNNIPVHLDGARIFNAAEYLGVEASVIAACADSAMFCLSKGLCAPVGSILVGEKAFIARARKNRKLLGGGMRQAGILAAAGILALDNMISRLHEDHANAKYLGERLKEILGLEVDMDSIHINMVFFKINNPITSDQFVSALYKKGIKSNGSHKGIYRFVTSNDVTKEHIDHVISSIKEILA